MKGMKKERDARKMKKENDNAVKRARKKGRKEGKEGRKKGD